VSPSDRPLTPRPLASSTAERVAKIVEAAERAATAVIDDAEAQARLYLEEAQAEADRKIADRLASLNQLSDSLMAQADAIRRQSERLVASLEAEGRTAAPAPAQPQPPEPPAPAPPAPAPRLSAVEAAPPPPAPTFVPPPPPPSPEPPAPEPAPAAAAPEPASEPDPTPAAARLLATQMAVSGASREEIETRLRTGFEIADPSPILDAILGPEG
jgi:vacuolar-type H+-ATPase subunit H